MEETITIIGAVQPLSVVAPRIKHKTPNDAVLSVAKMMGNSEEDLLKYGNEPTDSDLTGTDLAGAVLTVAKAMGVSEEDIVKYYSDPHDSGSDKCDIDEIKRLLMTD